MIIVTKFLIVKKKLLINFMYIVQRQTTNKCARTGQ